MSSLWPATLHFTEEYDLSNQGGIGFFWEGVGRGHVDIQIFTPTGAWLGRFPDYARKTGCPTPWVSLTWDKLQEVDIDGSRPDKSRITGILWTYHSVGKRWLDGIYGLPMGGDPDVLADMTIRHTAYNELFAEFETQDSAILFTKFELRQGIENLYVRFETYPVVDLYTKFEIN